MLALDGVSFSVRPGEALGVIGPNGAGKSTLLKVLAGILRADGGTLEVRGRVSALIELGAGFHPDLTGRENVFLNSAILGIPRREVHRRFNEIVEFAEVADALDEPIKRYSSGMQARLGFAIAAHVDAPIMLVDEVLSVGDRSFRARCLDRMHAARRDGAAILFVSHDLETVRRFCSSVLVLVAGRPAFLGSPAEAVARYHDLASDGLRLRGPNGGPAAEVSGIRICDEGGLPILAALPGQPAVLEYDARFNVPLPAPSYGLSLTSIVDQATLYETSSSRLGLCFPPVRAGDGCRVRCAFEVNVPPGEYAVGLHIRDREASRYVAELRQAVRLNVVGRAAPGLVFLDPQVEVDTLPSNLRFVDEIPPALQPATAF